MSLSKSRSFYAGLILLTFSTLMLEIIETRLLSVMTWYHLAFFVISAAMFGMTAGSVWVYLRRDRFTPETLSSDLVRFSSGFAVATLLSLLLQTTLASTIVLSASTVVVFTELALAMAAPFFFSGVAVSLALTRSPYPVGRVYAADLVGAALGCLGVLALLDVTDAPSAIILSGAVAAGAAVMFAAAGSPASATDDRSGGGALSKPLPILVVLAVLGIVNGTTKHGVQPILVKNSVEMREGDLLYEGWNSFSRIIAQGRGRFAPKLWGPSPKLPPEWVAEQINLNIDGLAGTVMFRFDGDVNAVEFLKYDVTNLAYALKPPRRAAVIGVGAGRDVLSAWMFGGRDITGVEINPIFVDLLLRKPPFAEFAGLRSLDGVRLVVDEARSWFARTPGSFDLIQMSMIDTWAATGAGAFTLTENGLYTVEAWKMFMGHLTDHGVFTVSRWYDPGQVNETGRMVSLAVATLLDSGVLDAQKHIFLAASDHVATLILARAPLSPDEVGSLTDASAHFGYKILIDPDTRAPGTEVLGHILAAGTREDLDRYTSGLDLDLTPPTDNRPFFFNLLPMARPDRVLRLLSPGTRRGVVPGNLLAVLTLTTILVVSVLLVVATIVLPLRRAVSEIGSRLAVGGTSYFALLGFGFMFAEIGLLQRLSVFLGHPIYSLSVVLFSLILSTGMGSFVSEKAALERRAARFIAWSALLGGYLVALPLWLPGVMQAFQASGTPVRAALSVAVIVPAGLMMGFGFPTGMRLVQAIDDRPTPWFWGINGAAGVLASVLAVWLSIAAGINATIFAAGACYVALIPALLAMGTMGAMGAMGTMGHEARGRSSRVSADRT